AGSLASTSALTGLGGHGLPTRSTGHVGPADTVPCRPDTAADGDARRGGVGPVEAAGDADPAAGVEDELVEDEAVEDEPVEVTPGGAPTAAGGEVDCRQAARATKPSNAGRATLS